MAATSLSAECRLGIPLFDEAHEALAEQIGNLLDGPEEDFADGLSLLMGCLEEDFQVEEALMKALRYPALPAHRAQHARALSILHGLDVANREACRNAVQQLLAWFHTHLATADTALAKALQNGAMRSAQFSAK